jgi:hypothetical protein
MTKPHFRLGIPFHPRRRALIDGDIGIDGYALDMTHDFVNKKDHAGLGPISSPNKVSSGNHHPRRVFFFVKPLFGVAFHSRMNGRQFREA